MSLFSVQALTSEHPANFVRRCAASAYIFEAPTLKTEGVKMRNGKSRMTNNRAFWSGAALGSLVNWIAAVALAGARL